MSSIKAFKRNRRLSVKANVITPYYPVLAQRGHAASAVVITNKTTVTLYVAEHDRPDLDYDMAIPPGSAGPLVNPEGINSLYLFASADGFFDATEVSTDAPDLQFQVWNMQFTATSPLPTGYNIIGRTITQNAAGDINAGNPLHIVGTGAGGSSAVDVTDRLARALGLVGPAVGSLWDIADRAARLLGKTGIQVAGADVAANNAVPVKPANGLTPAEVTFAAAETKQVKAAAGRVFAIVAKGCDVTLKDAAANVWFVQAGASFSFPRPAECATSIQLTSSAAGSAYVQYE